MQLDYYLIPYTNITQNVIEDSIKDLSVRNEAIKFLEENISSTQFDFSLGNIFPEMFSQSREARAKINKWNFTKLKNFCTAKEIISKMKRWATKREEIFVHDISDKGLISKIYKELIQPKESERKVKSLSRVRLCYPMDSSPPGSSVHRIL